MLLAAAVAMGAACGAQHRSKHFTLPPDTAEINAENRILAELRKESAPAAADTIATLTEEDFREVAEELGIETACLHAVIDIEAGKAHQGFTAPGQPVVNFDLTMFRRFAAKRGVNLTRYRRSHPAVFSRGRSAGSAFKRFSVASTINSHAAIEGTFWGMFQIGGFNWRKCGAKDIDEFYQLMCRSERDQLELFAKFIVNSGLQKPLQAKNWAAFARGYNGPGYARRGYHNRLGAAYRKYAGK